MTNIRSSNQESLMKSPARFRRVAAMAVVIVSLAGASACEPLPPSPATAPPQGSNILVFGDSITQEVFGSPEAAAIMNGYYKVSHAQTTRFLTAPCTELSRNLSGIPTPAAVIINYNGNKGSFGTNCMNDESGNALYTRYRNDLQTLIQKVKTQWPSTKIVMMSGPYRAPAGADNDSVKRAHVDAAKNKGVGYFDGSRNISVGNTAPNYMYCLSVETSGTVVTNSSGAQYKLKCLSGANKDKNLVREGNGNHLCPPPGSLRFTGACEAVNGSLLYSSGAVRLALNMKEALGSAK